MAGLQLFIAVYTLHQFPPFSHYNTLVQFSYFSLTAVWIAWYVREILSSDNPDGLTQPWQLSLRQAAAVWLFGNGILLLLQSLAHPRVLGEITETFREYFPSSGWITQHSILSGILMIYVSRHLLRGELRARQLALLLLGLEIMRNAVVAPRAGILSVLLVGFVVLFVSRDAFRLGTVPVTVSLKRKDAFALAAGLVITVLLSAVFIVKGHASRQALERTARNYTTLIQKETGPHDRDRSAVIFARSLTVFTVASAAILAWALFRPVRALTETGSDSHEVLAMLKRYASHSEDYFKYWPADKQYYWIAGHTGFLAYKKLGSVVFVLADPIGPEPGLVLEEFTRLCQANRITVCCLPVYEPSLPLYQRAGYKAIHIGSSAVIDVQTFASVTCNNKWWRWQRNRAVKRGYVYKVSLAPHSPEFLRQLRHVSDLWLRTGGHREEAFTMGYFDENYLNVCTVYYLTDSSGAVVAFANEIPQFNQTATATVDLIRFNPEADNTMPYLLSRLILDLAENKPVSHFDLGFVPFAKTTSPFMTIAQKLSGSRFSAKGLEQFKNKFEPSWQPNYLAYSGDLADLGVAALKMEAVMSAPMAQKRSASRLTTGRS